MHSSLLSAAVGGLLIASISQAAPDDPPNKLEQVVVTATRAAEGQSSAVLGSSITVLEPKVLEERQVRIISDVLRDVPGVAVNRSGTVGGLTQVRIRGSEGNHVLTLIDGIEASDPFQGEFDYATLIADDVARVEVLRGQQSALYGSDAIGGVIHYITATGREAPGFRTRLEGGSFGTYETSARFGGATDTVDYAFSGGFQSTEGVRTARAGQRHVGAENTALSAHLGYQATDNFSLKAIARYSYTDAELNDQDFGFPPGPTFGAVIDSDDHYHNQALYGLVSGELTSFDDHWVNTLSVQGTDVERRSFSDGLRDFSTEGSRLKGSWVSTVNFGSRVAQSITLAGDFEREEMQNISPAITAAQGIERRTDNTGVVAQYDAVINERIGFGAALRHDDNERFDDADTYKVQASYRFDTGTRLRAAAGSGIKNPSVFELFGFDPATFIGNPNLEPERSEGWEVGLEQSFTEAGVLVGITYFDSTLRDEIFTSFSPTFISSPSNRTTDSTQNGIEVFVKAQLGTAWTVDASYTDLNAKENGVEEIRRPPHLGSLNIGWRTASNRAGANLTVRYNGETFDNNFGIGPPRVRLDEFTLVNLGADFNMNDHMQLYGRIENLFDEDYEEVFTYRTPGRAGYAGVRIKF